MKTEFYIAARYFVALKQTQKHQSPLRKLQHSLFLCYIIKLFFQIVIALFSFSNKRISRFYKEIIDNFIRQNFIRILSNISMFGVGVACAALIIVLSVFNGLETLTKTLFRSYNPELKVESKKGKTFVPTAEQMQAIAAITHITAVTEVVEDNILLHYQNKQMVAKAKGVSQNYRQQYALDTALILGDLHIDKGPISFALVGLGVYHQLSIQLDNRHTPLQLWYPQADELLKLNPEKSFKRKTILPNGVLSIEQQFDANTIIVPVEFMRSLLNYKNHCSYLEIKTSNKKHIPTIKIQLEKILGANYTISDSKEQQADILRAVQIERLFVFVTFAFILLIASFNIFFSLAILSIEKKKDIDTLFSMGATKAFISKIFLFQGAIISLTGACSGLGLGALLCWMQQTFNVFTFAVQSNILQAYPVRISWTDFAYVAILVLLITFAASSVPAYNAARRSF